MDAHFVHSKHYKSFRVIKTSSRQSVCLLTLMIFKSDNDHYMFMQAIAFLYGRDIEHDLYMCNFSILKPLF